MKDELLVNDVIRRVDEAILNLEVYYTFKNINKLS